MSQNRFELNMVRDFDENIKLYDSPYRNGGAQSIGASKLNQGIATRLYKPSTEYIEASNRAVAKPNKDEILRFQLNANELTNFGPGAETFKGHLNSSNETFKRHLNSSNKTFKNINETYLNTIHKYRKNGLKHSRRERFTLTEVINSNSDFERIFNLARSTSDEILKEMEKMKGSYQSYGCFYLPLDTEFITTEIYNTLLEQRVANKYGGKTVVDVFDSPKSVSDAIVSSYNEVLIMYSNKLNENHGNIGNGSILTKDAIQEKVHENMNKKRNAIYISPETAAQMKNIVETVVEDTTEKKISKKPFKYNDITNEKFITKANPRARWENPSNEIMKSQDKLSRMPIFEPINKERYDESSTEAAETSETHEASAGAAVPLNESETNNTGVIIFFIIFGLIFVCAMVLGAIKMFYNMKMGYPLWEPRVVVAPRRRY